MKSENGRGQGGAERPREKGGQRRRGGGAGVQGCGQQRARPGFRLEIAGWKQVKRPARPR